MQVQIIFSRDSELASVLENIVSQQNIPMDSEASVFVGRDTRKSSPALSTAVLDGVNSVKVGFVYLTCALVTNLKKFLILSGVFSKRLWHRLNPDDPLLCRVQEHRRRLRGV